MAFEQLHARIRIKLLGLVLLPVVGGGALSGLGGAQQTRLLHRMQRLRAASSLSVSVGRLAHALQLESVDSALHLGIRGAQHQEEMVRAREATNQARVALEAAVAETEAPYRGLIPARAREGGRLGDLRQRVDRQGGTVEGVDGYGREVEALVQLQGDLMLPAAGTPLEGRSLAFTTLVRAKQAASLEAALLANACSQGTLDAGRLDRIQNLREAQKARGEAFLEAASPDLQEAFRQALGGSFSADLQRVRAGLQAGALDQDADGWALAADAELEAYQGVQDRLSGELLADARSLEQGARAKSWALLAGFSVFGLVVLLWTWRATQLITEPIQALADGMARLRQGDLRIHLPVRSQDETGRMTEAFNAMTAHLRELARTLQAHAARVSSGAAGLSSSAEQVSAVTQQLGKSSRVQRLASDGVAASVTQLQESVDQVRTSLDAMLAGGEEAGRNVQSATRRARALVTFLQALVDRSDPSLHRALGEGEAQMISILQTLEQVEETLKAFEIMAGDIHRATEDQSKVSGEVSIRMRASQEATGEAQRAAAQLANTAPEVVLTSQDLVQVAESLKGAAAVFQVE